MNLSRLPFGNETAQGGEPWAFFIDDVHGRQAGDSLGSLWDETTLFAQPKTGNGGTVSLDVLVREVGQQAPPLADELEQTAAGVKIMPVGTEMIGKAVDALGQQSDLHLRRAGIFWVRSKLRNDGLFLFAL
jgi:hypothetical protein